MNDGIKPMDFSRFQTSPGIAPQRRSLADWSSSEALAESIGRNRGGMGRRLGLSRSMIDRWCQQWGEVHDHGSRNPLDRIEEWVEYLRHEGEPEARAVLPVLWLNDRLGYRLEAEGGAMYPDSIPVSAGRLSAEIADVVNGTLRALDDGELTPMERQAIGREIREAELALTDLKKKLNVGAA